MLSRKRLPSLPNSPEPLTGPDLERLQGENRALRLQLARLQEERQVEKDHLIATLRAQNGQLLRKVHQLNQAVGKMARGMKDALSEWNHLQQPEVPVRHQPGHTEEITVYSQFDSD